MRNKQGLDGALSCWSAELEQAAWPSVGPCGRHLPSRLCLPCSAHCSGSVGPRSSAHTFIVCAFIFLASCKHGGSLQWTSRWLTFAFIANRKGECMQAAGRECMHAGLAVDVAAEEDKSCRVASGPQLPVSPLQTPVQLYSNGRQKTPGGLSDFFSLKQEKALKLLLLPSLSLSCNKLKEKNATQ